MLKLHYKANFAIIKNVNKVAHTYVNIKNVDVRRNIDCVVEDVFRQFYKLLMKRYRNPLNINSKSNI